MKKVRCELWGLLGESILGRGHSKCKGPGMSTYLAYLRERKGANADLVCVCVCVCD